jgi:hypothetical protein
MLYKADDELQFSKIIRVGIYDLQNGAQGVVT